MNPITYLHGEIDIKKFKKGPKINKGGFGTVYQVKDIKTSKHQKNMRQKLSTVATMYYNAIK